MTTISHEPNLSLDECITIITTELGNKGRHILLQMRRRHNKAIYSENGSHASCSATKAVKEMERDIRALALTLQGK